MHRPAVGMEGFVHLVARLFSPEGMAGGGISRPAGCLEDDGTGRSVLDRVVQAALFSRVAAPFPGAQYDAATHTWGGGLEAQGLQPRQTRELVSVLTDDPSIQALPGQPGCAAHLGRQGSFLAALYSLGVGAHQVLVEKVDQGQVLYRDPEGPRATPFEGAEAFDAGRGLFSLSLEDFEDQLATVTAPARTLPAEMLPPEAWIF